MQKVEGSSPFSRSLERPAFAGLLCFWAATPSRAGSTISVCRAGFDVAGLLGRLAERDVHIVENADGFGAEIASGQIAREAERWIGPFRESFPDFRMEVVGVVAEADKVVGHFRCSGTHLGDWRQMPASGRRFEDVDQIYIFRVKDGKLDSALAVVEDNLTRMQLGLVSIER